MYLRGRPAGSAACSRTTRDATDQPGDALRVGGFLCLEAKTRGSISLVLRDTIYSFRKHLKERRPLYLPSSGTAISKAFPRTMGSHDVPHLN